MSNDPYDQGRYGGGPPPSGPDFGEWSRGNQDRLKGLEQQDSGGSSGPLLGDDPHAQSEWPQQRQNVGGGETEGGESAHGFTVDSGCAVLLLVLVGAWLAGVWLTSGALPR